MKRKEILNIFRGKFVRINDIDFQINFSSTIYTYWVFEPGDEHNSNYYFLIKSKEFFDCFKTKFYAN